MKRSSVIIIFYGVLLWIVPFIVSFFVFPFKTVFPALFETVMAVTVSLCVVVLAVLYFKRVATDYVKVGIVIGTIWMAISVLIDLPLFLFGGPMQMSLQNYLMDVGLTYLIYPIVTTGFGYLLANIRGAA